MLKACSHIVLVSNDVVKTAGFFEALFDLPPYFKDPAFTEFVFPNQFRLAFFTAVGKAADFFECEPSRKSISLGLTVDDVDALYEKLTKIKDHWGAQVSGPPKPHPWGEKSFLLIDPDDNRWEITQAPSESGMLVNREKAKS